MSNGVSRRQLESRLRAGEFVRVRPGLYLPAADVATGVNAAEDRLALRTLAAAGTHGEGTVVSHESALALHALPVYGFDATRVTTTRSRPGSGTRRSDSSICHSANLEGSIVELDGVPVTSVERTVVDVARLGGFDGALCAADAALKTRKCSLADLRREPDAAVGRTGIAQARAVVGFADAKAESVLESISRLALHRLRPPLPALQVTFRLSSGRAARVGMYWEDLNLVGECDGVVKYGFERGSATARQAIIEEKERQIDIEADGFRVVRWMMKHAENPAILEKIISVAMNSRRDAGFGKGSRLII